MKFSVASSVAIVAAFAPSLVSAANLTVIVGAGRDGQPGLRFDPQQVVAQKGDIVSFEFRGGNHTVTQSTFANPCAWQLNSVTNQTGFNSGFIPFDPASRQVGVYSLQVDDPATPIWFFCGRPPHCKNGMFGAINPPTTGNKTFDLFTANVASTEEPGLDRPLPFTPPASSSSSSSPSSGTAAPSSPNNSVRPSSSGASPTSNGAATSTGAAVATQSSAAAGSVTARSTVILGLAGLTAGLVL